MRLLTVLVATVAAAMAAELAVEQNNPPLNLVALAAQNEGKTVPFTFRWPRGGNQVRIAGSFIQWNSLPMVNRGNNEWSLVFRVLPGPMQFKFIVDGQFVLDQNQPTCNDPNNANIQNHCVDVPADDPSDDKPNVQGRWKTNAVQLPNNLNPIHVSLLKNGNLLMVSGTGNCVGPNNKKFIYGIYNVQQQKVTTREMPFDAFCGSISQVGDGRFIVVGGTQRYDPFFGERRTLIYDPQRDAMSLGSEMADGRWYPTTVVMGDGRVFAFGGLSGSGGINPTGEYFTADANRGSWSPQVRVNGDINWTPPLYPRLHLLPDGQIFYSVEEDGSRLFNPNTGRWSGVIARTRTGVERVYGASILLPLRPSNQFRARVMIFGGGRPRQTETTEIIEPLASNPNEQGYRMGPPMSGPRIQMDAVILPDGKVLAVGGSHVDEESLVQPGTLTADLYDPATNTMSPAGVMEFPHLYHSAAVLLPDATVMVTGGNPQRCVFENHTEVYQPPYLFDDDGKLAVRPKMEAMNQPTIALGSTFTVKTADANNIRQVVVIMMGSKTHAHDANQRLVELTFQQQTNALSVRMEGNPNLIPPGMYMLFILNRDGVPSVAEVIRIARPPKNAANAREGLLDSAADSSALPAIIAAIVGVVVIVVAVVVILFLRRRRQLAKANVETPSLTYARRSKAKVRRSSHSRAGNLRPIPQ